jgi:hypothetical protein
MDSNTQTNKLHRCNSMSSFGSIGATDWCDNSHDTSPHCIVTEGPNTQNTHYRRNSSDSCNPLNATPFLPHISTPTSTNCHFISSLQDFQFGEDTLSLQSTGISSQKSSSSSHRISKTSKEYTLPIRRSNGRHQFRYRSNLMFPMLTQNSRSKHRRNNALLALPTSKELGLVNDSDLASLVHGNDFFLTESNAAFDVQK